MEIRPDIFEKAKDIFWKEKQHLVNYRQGKTDCHANYEGYNLISCQ